MRVGLMQLVYRGRTKRWHTCDITLYLHSLRLPRTRVETLELSALVVVGPGQLPSPFICSVIKAVGKHFNACAGQVELAKLE
jgi:hypothetical protein